jgi:hypothetical protein
MFMLEFIRMKVILNQEMQAFFRRCLKNIGTDKNQFLGMSVTPGREKYLQKQLARHGFAEFRSPEPPSLFLSADAWEKTPYHSHIDLTRITSHHFTFEKDLVRGRELFNADAIQKDPERELNDYMKLRAMDRDFEAVYLYQDEKDWMLDAPSEAFTNDPYAEKAHGRVLTLGLGIGYFLYMCTLNPQVREITVIERSPDVIDMFCRDILPQFHTPLPIHFIAADAFACWQDEQLKQYDYIYADIWQSSDDGLACITRLLQQFNPPYEKTDFWIEDSCYEIMWTLSFYYFYEKALGRKMNPAPMYQPYMDLIRTYYDRQGSTITSSEKIKERMYDTRTIRAILAGQ